MKKLYTFENRWHQRYVSLLLLVIFFFMPMFAMDKMKQDWVWIVQLSCYGIFLASYFFIYLFTDYCIPETDQEPE